jgi:hypothetical protein
MPLENNSRESARRSHASRIGRWLRGGEPAQVERRQLAFTAALVVGLHLLPRLVLRHHSYLTVHDNLDSDLLYRVIASRDGRMFSSHAIVTELLGGLPRWDYPSPFKLGTLLCWLLPTFWAYVTLEAIVRAVAVVGMGLLLRDYVPAAREHRLAIAATFGILPYFTIYDLSVAGEPFVAWALLNLWHERRIRGSLAVCAAYPFASVLWTGAPFFLLLAAMWLATAALRARRLPRYALGGLLVVALGYAAADHAYLAGMARNEFVSHRAAWHPKDFEAARFLRETSSMFFQGGYHAATLHAPILVAILVIAPLLIMRGYRREATVLYAVIVAAAFCALSLQGGMVLGKLYALKPSLRQVNIRFWWTLPLIWYTGLALIARDWSKTGLRRGALNALLAIQFATAFVVPYGAPKSAEPELRTNYVLLIERLLGRPPSAISYGEFMSERTFAQIRKHIGADTGRFLSIGLHPAIAAYNGFDCADGEHDNYPLAYKRRFRKLIDKELRRNGHYRERYETWGSRAYVFVHDFVSRDLDERPPPPPRRLSDLSLNEKALHDLGVKWIVSALRLVGAARPAFLRAEGNYGTRKAGYVLFLYRVVD